MSTEQERRAAYEDAVAAFEKARKDLIEATKWLGKEYYDTPRWAEIRKSKMISKHFTCEWCRSKKDLQVHHLTYDNFGCENLWDLKLLCNKCHEKAHKELKGTQEGKRQREWKRKKPKSKEPFRGEQYALTTSDKQTVCIVCRKAIDYDNECYVGVHGSKVHGRVLCVDCHNDPEREKAEKRIHEARVISNSELPPKKKRYRDRLIKKLKVQKIPSSLRGSYALRQDYLDALKRDE